MSLHSHSLNCTHCLNAVLDIGYALRYQRKAWKEHKLSFDYNLRINAYATIALFIMRIEKQVFKVRRTLPYCIRRV
jgi:hypothetical protein